MPLTASYSANAELLLTEEIVCVPELPSRARRSMHSKWLADHGYSLIFEVVQPLPPALEALCELQIHKVHQGFMVHSHLMFYPCCDVLPGVKSPGELPNWPPVHDLSHPVELVECQGTS